MFGRFLSSTIRSSSSIQTQPQWNAKSLSSAFMKQQFSYLVGNIPPTMVFIRKEYLTQFEEGHGELEQGVWISVKSKKDRAFLFETLFYDYGALYDKLPISAFLWKEEVDFDNLLPLDYLQLWNCMSYEFSVIQKVNLESLRCEVLMKNGKYYPGVYMYTIDPCKSNPNEISCNWSDLPAEHKSFNIIKLDNGQFTAQPNNRIKWLHSSLIPTQTKSAKFFKVCEVDYQVEDTPKWSVADTNSYFYKEKTHEENVSEETSAPATAKATATTTAAPAQNSTTTATTAPANTTAQSTGAKPAVALQKGEKVRITGADAVNFNGGTHKPY